MPSAGVTFACAGGTFASEVLISSFAGDSNRDLPFGIRVEGEAAGEPFAFLCGAGDAGDPARFSRLFSVALGQGDTCGSALVGDAAACDISSAEAPRGNALSIAAMLRGGGSHLKTATASARIEADRAAVCQQM